MTAVHGRRPKCYRCGRPAKARCDAPRPRGQGGTCGKAFCGAHGKYVGRGRDHCADCLGRPATAAAEEE